METLEHFINVDNKIHIKDVVGKGSQQLDNIQKISGIAGNVGCAIYYGIVVLDALGIVEIPSTEKKILDKLKAIESSINILIDQQRELKIQVSNIESNIIFNIQNIDFRTKIVQLKSIIDKIFTGGLQSDVICSFCGFFFVKIKLKRLA